MAAVIAAVLLTTGCSLLGAPPLSNTPKNLFAQSKPGTVLIWSTFTARVTVPNAVVDEPRIEAELKRQVSAGELDATDEAAIAGAYFDLLVTDPLTYIEPDESTAKRAKDLELQATGSGFVADPKGYVVTNAHVAAPKDAELKKELAGRGLKQFIEEDAKAFIEAAGADVPQSAVEQFVAALTEWNAHYMQVESLTKKVSVIQGANIPGVATGVKEIPADVVTAGEPTPGKDVAVLRIEQTNLPSLEMGDDSSLGTGDKLFVMGYPFDATFHPVLSEESIAEPSFTGGQVSAKKQASKGFEVIQTDAAVAPGNSGGPVLDANGKVVGIMTFGSVDPATGQQVQGFNFVMPASVINEFLDRAGAHPQEGAFSKLYKEALAEESAGHYKDALAVLQRIERLAPGHPYVQQRISQTEAAVTAGKDKSVNTAMVVGIPLVAVAALAVIAVAIVMMRRKGLKPAPVAVPSDETPAAPSGTAPMGGTQTRIEPQPPQQPRAPAPPSGQEDAYDELRKLHDLRDEGIISDEEFQAKKAELLGRM